MIRSDGCCWSSARIPLAGGGGLFRVGAWSPENPTRSHCTGKYGKKRDSPSPSERLSASCECLLRLAPTTFSITPVGVWKPNYPQVMTPLLRLGWIVRYSTHLTGKMNSQKGSRQHCAAGIVCPATSDTVHASYAITDHQLTGSSEISCISEHDRNLSPDSPIDVTSIRRIG